ncbi:glutamine-rich protein 2-like [Alosa alosa]|uniref:glutamine-rich protein 2-like n=1 Tax=Alosa alosa TaxID=278164 RepID=UPI00201546E3|nr:glutamine-rich protein 2-like [Alosa alosa]
MEGLSASQRWWRQWWRALASLSRAAEGSHRVHYPQRRYTRLQNITHLIQAEDEESISTLRIQPEEVDILGLDGHIYKGRLNTLSSRPIKSLEQRLPVINPKEGKGTMKHKLTVSPKNAGDLGRVTPIRPQSAKTQRCRSASSTTTKDRPLSSIGCGSRDTDQPQRPLQLTVISPNQRTSR